VVSTLAGTPREAGSQDGVGSAARFVSPTALTVDASGNLYVADSGDSTIRKVTPDGVVTTVAGASAYRERIRAPLSAPAPSSSRLLQHAVGRVIRVTSTSAVFID
jgi:hypothetical protein